LRWKTDGARGGSTVTITTASSIRLSTSPATAKARPRALSDLQRDEKSSGSRESPGFTNTSITGSPLKVADNGEPHFDRAHRPTVHGPALGIEAVLQEIQALRAGGIVPFASTSAANGRTPAALRSDREEITQLLAPFALQKPVPVPRATT